MIHAELSKNLEVLKKRFGQSDDMMFYSFTYGNGKCDACLIYIDGLTDNQLLAEYIISPVQAAARHQEEPAETPPSSISFGYRHTRLSSLKDAEADIFSGKSVLLAEGGRKLFRLRRKHLKCVILKNRLQKCLNGAEDRFCRKASDEHGAFARAVR